MELLAQDRGLWGLVTLWGSTMIVGVLIHWAGICRSLYGHGAKFPTGFLFWRVFHELRWYKAVTSADGNTPTLYYVSFIFMWFNLLFALAIALRILWLQSPQGRFPS